MVVCNSMPSNSPSPMFERLLHLQNLRGTMADQLGRMAGE
jgi:hypothetical protein